ncbi:MAG: hypothetical protein GY778_09550, partial [bacterium]|nr:hypothetical protein [bacterium]
NAEWNAWFTDPANADFSLQDGTQFVDLGFNLAGTVDDDYCQSPRPVNAIWDIGAVEYGQPTCDTSLKGAGGPAPTYVLTVALSGSGSGTVTSSPAGIDCGSDCTEEYPSGTFVELTATPDADSYFAGWSGHADCSDGQVTMNGDRNCTATFNFGPPPTYTLTVTKTGTGSGTVTSSPPGIDCGSDCTEDYPQGTIVGLTATPDAGSFFNGWSGDADCSDGQVTMNGDRDCTAVFGDASSSLVAAYGLDEGSGGVVADASGNQNDGTISG